jgi:hypothetical protein
MKCKHKNCKYRSKLTHGISFCDYIGHEKHSRGCAAENCDKYVKKTRRRANKELLISTDKEKILASRERVNG